MHTAGPEHDPAVEPDDAGATREAACGDVRPGVGDVGDGDAPAQEGLRQLCGTRSMVEVVDHEARRVVREGALDIRARCEGDRRGPRGDIPAPPTEAVQSDQVPAGQWRLGDRVVARLEIWERDHVRQGSVGVVVETERRESGACRREREVLGACGSVLSMIVSRPKFEVLVNVQVMSTPGRSVIEAVPVARLPVPLGVQLNVVSVKPGTAAWVIV